MLDRSCADRNDCRIISTSRATIANLELDILTLAAREGRCERSNIPVHHGAHLRIGSLASSPFAPVVLSLGIKPRVSKSGAYCAMSS